MDATEADSIREELHSLYTKLRQNKALRPTSHGLTALVIDGHESHSTYLRHCDGCCERRVKRGRAWVTQYYHRQVSAMLLTRPFPIWLDIEPLKPGDDELTAAKRLLERMLRTYPRAFDIVLGDALYSDAKIYALLRRHGKDVLTVLKANQRGLLQDAQALLEEAEPVVYETDKSWLEIREVGNFTEVWPELDHPLRVIRSREGRSVKRQLEGQPEELLSEWLWVSTATAQRAHTEALVA